MCTPVNDKMLSQGRTCSFLFDHVGIGRSFTYFLFFLGIGEIYTPMTSSLDADRVVYPYLGDGIDRATPNTKTRRIWGTLGQISSLIGSLYIGRNQ